MVVGIRVEHGKVPYPFHVTELQKKYGKLSELKKSVAVSFVKEMFTFSFMNYMVYAYPKDELDPIHCTGRGPDYEHPYDLFNVFISKLSFRENININDVLGDYSLTLVDSLTTLAIFKEKKMFHDVVNLITKKVRFDKNVNVQVFEATIRVIGSLLSSHLMLINENPYVGNMTMDTYGDQLLILANDLARRLMDAFDKSDTSGILTNLPIKVSILCSVAISTS